MAAYYNENDPKAAAWLRELILRGHIAPGEVDERSIVDVRPEDLTGFAQCHFFAGIGGWSYALRLAGWPDDRPAWTGSCPCQPFSVAGKREGIADKRHLWPEFQRLISQCHPSIVFGEQVASRDGRTWLAGVRADLEALGYAVGAADLCAAGIGAPHIRQRLYWVADAVPAGRAEGWAESGRGSIAGCGATRWLEHTNLSGQHGRPSGREQSLRNEHIEAGGMGDADGRQPGDGELQRSGQHGQQPQDGIAGGMAYTLPAGRAESGNRPTAWSSFDVLACTDGKARRVESGTFPLAHGIPARMGRLRGYGNAVTPQIAAEFIQAYLNT